MKYTFSSILFLVLLSIFTSCGPSGPQPGEEAPHLELIDVDGNSVALKDYRGKLVLLHFWTDWCDACREEFPKMQAYYKEIGGNDFELLAVNVGQDSAAVDLFRKDFNVTFPMCMDEEAVAARIYGIEQFPTNYLINPEGTISRRVVGWVDREFVENVLYNIERGNKGGE